MKLLAVVMTRSVKNQGMGTPVSLALAQETPLLVDVYLQGTPSFYRDFRLHSGIPSGFVSGNVFSLTGKDVFFFVTERKLCFLVQNHSSIYTLFVKH